MKMKVITAKYAYELTEKLGLCVGDDGRTFYATNEDETEVWEFDTKKERDDFVIEAIKREIEQEVDKQYNIESHKPDGFGDNMYQYKLGILSDMYEKEEALGAIPKDREKAFVQIAKEYETMSSWN